MESPAGGGAVHEALRGEVARAAANAPAKARATGKRSGFIVNPFYDGIFLIFSPLIALAIGIAISGTRLSEGEIEIGEFSGSVTNLFISSFIAAHLVIVFIRSHFNRSIFRLYPIRFTVVPVALLAAMMWSRQIAISVFVLAIWWDVYHSSLQTFGIGRIYDVRVGNDPMRGRRLDYILNLLLYAGPILAGATLMDHMEHFDEFSKVGSVFFTAVPAYVQSNQRYLSWSVLLFGIPFIVFYLWSYRKFHRQGYQVSFQKVLLLASTALCSIYTWGFNTFGEAFFIMNFFHALQYFAIVWWAEGKNMVSSFRLGRLAWGKPIALGLFVLLGFGYGFWSETSAEQSAFAVNLVLVVAVMHFWYDGFIWSVRKKQV